MKATVISLICPFPSPLATTYLFSISVSLFLFIFSFVLVYLNHGYAANYQIIVDRVHNSDTLDVQVEMTPEMFTDNLGEISQRQEALVDGLRSMLGLAAKVTLVEPKTIARSEGKAVRVIDKRKI